MTLVVGAVRVPELFALEVELPADAPPPVPPVAVAFPEVLVLVLLPPVAVLLIVTSIEGAVGC
jgi:hypothetical protein